MATIYYVVRTVPSGYATSAVEADSPFEALRHTRAMSYLSGSESELHAFTIETEMEGNPWFVHRGMLESAVES